LVPPRPPPPPPPPTPPPTKPRDGGLDFIGLDGGT
jgi:hypothetical protein